MDQSRITFMPDYISHLGRPPTKPNHETNCTPSTNETSSKTYRCLVDVVHGGHWSAACPNSVLAQREEVLSSSGQNSGLILGGFYRHSLALSDPPWAEKPPLCLCLKRVSCVRLVNLSQSPGSDKNAEALRGHTLEWNDV